VTWFKVDDSFYDHPKVFDLPDSAVALWTRAGCWSARNYIDVHIQGRGSRVIDPGSFPGYCIPLTTEALASRIIGGLMEAG
jgi:hypothetical protein